MHADYKTIAVLAPHTDDGEIGCGGTIARFVEEGRTVYYIAFSTARTSVRPEFPSNILEIEVMQATAKLGIPENNVILFDFPVRHFPEHRQTILQLPVNVLSLCEKYAVKRKFLTTSDPGS